MTEKRYLSSGSPGWLRELRLETALSCRQSVPGHRSAMFRLWFRRGARPSIGHGRDQAARQEHGETDRLSLIHLLREYFRNRSGRCRLAPRVLPAVLSVPSQKVAGTHTSMPSSRTRPTSQPRSSPSCLALKRTTACTEARAQQIRRV